MPGGGKYQKMGVGVGLKHLFMPYLHWFLARLEVPSRKELVSLLESFCLSACVFTREPRLQTLKQMLLEVLGELGYAYDELRHIPHKRVLSSLYAVTLSRESIL